MEVALQRSGIDRRRQDGLSLRFPERRTGFDRRLPTNSLVRSLQLVLLWLRDSPVLLVILAGVNLLSLADLGMTLYLLRHGAVEANPILAGIFNVSWLAAASVKVVLVVLVTLTLWRLRKYRSVLLLVPAVLMVFTALVFYEVVLIITVA